VVVDGSELASVPVCIFVSPSTYYPTTKPTSTPHQHQKPSPLPVMSDTYKPVASRKRQDVEAVEDPRKRSRTSAAPIKQTINTARIEFWSKNGSWPTDQQELTIDHFRQLVNHAHARKRSSSRKTSASHTSTTEIADSMSRDLKYAPYKHPMFEIQLKEAGSSMNEHELGITAENKRLCQQLLNAPQEVPENTLFSDDILFKKTCKRMKGENESKIVHRISELVVPSAELLADRGAKHLAIVRETTNACWTNSEPFISPHSSGSDCRLGPQPQPDFGFGFDRDAFTSEQLHRLAPFLGDLLEDYSLFAATYQMYFPFLTCEVACGDEGLDIADRQNAYTQSIILRGLYWLFKLVGREEDLHREICGFSISHNDESVRIWGYYAFIDGTGVKFYRHLISMFPFVPSGEGDQRWKAYKFVKNLYDLWLPDHFRRICSAVDMLPVGLDVDAFNMPESQSSDPDLDSMPSGPRKSLNSNLCSFSESM
jgi:hypothetical protein